MALLNKDLLNDQFIITALQGEDIIIQRLDHVIEGFYTFRRDFLDKKFKHAFLDLEYFQLIAIGRDLQQLIISIQNLSMQGDSDNGKRGKLFPRYDEIRELLEIAIRLFRRSGAQRLFVGPVPFTALQTSACFALYTMHAERIVFEWFLSNVPFTTRKGFIKAYEHQLTKITSDSIEFF